MTTTPALWQFAGAYLHEDWAEESGDEWGALGSFVTDSPELARSLPAEIARVLEECPNEADLEAYVRGEGACYRPDPAAGGYRGWLTEVARRVAAATGSGAAISSE